MTCSPRRASRVTILLLMFVPALPLPTGGITHVFETDRRGAGRQMMLGFRTILLPDRWRRRELGSLITGKAVPFVIRRVRWFERFSRPAAAALFRSVGFSRIIGLVFVALAIAAALAPPFTGLDTLPALGAVVVALGGDSRRRRGARDRTRHRHRWRRAHPHDRRSNRARGGKPLLRLVRRVTGRVPSERARLARRSARLRLPDG